MLHCGTKLPILLIKIAAAQNEVTELSYHRVLGLYFLAVIFATSIFITFQTFKRNMLKAARELFVAFNKNVFSNQLPDDLEIKLNKRLFISYQ